MFKGPVERAGEPLVDGLRSCCDHLQDDEVYEICSRGGEAELNDLLRHAINREIRPLGWISQREQSRSGMPRVDLLISDMGSGMPFGVVEAKMCYATDAVESVKMVRSHVDGDVAKLSRVDPIVPRFFLMWAPYFAVVRRPLRYMAGHVAHGDEWLPRLELDQVRQAMQALLVSATTTPQHVVVRSCNGTDGKLTLDAWLAVPAETVA